MESALTIEAVDKLLKKRIAELKTELSTDVAAAVKNLATSDELSRIRTRLEDIEQTSRIIRQAPYRPEPTRHTHRETRANSVSGPIYR